MSEDHSHAGQGAVLLDIGGDVGALIVHTPGQMAGREIEICPDGERDECEHPQHVAVLSRPAGSRHLHTAVFPALLCGRYELWVKPDGATRLRAMVTGGRITEVSWPDA